MMMRRVLAHRVVHQGRVYGLSVVDIAGSGIVIEPFVRETASTPFVDGTVFVLDARYAPEEMRWASAACDAVLAHWHGLADETTLSDAHPLKII